jgi:hypothetical protein
MNGIIKEHYPRGHKDEGLIYDSNADKNLPNFGSSGGAVSSITIPNLHGDQDGEYLIKYKLYLPSYASNRNLSLKPNNDAGNANTYGTQAATSNSSVTYLSSTNIYFGSALNGAMAICKGTLEIDGAYGNPDVILGSLSVNLRRTDGSIQVNAGCVYSLNNAIITSLVIALDYGTFYGRVRVYKVK